MKNSARGERVEPCDRCTTMVDSLRSLGKFCEHP
jgi:hypothetical protein